MQIVFVTSYLALWVIVLVLTLVCLALARELGIALHRLGPAGAAVTNEGPAVGEIAPSWRPDNVSNEGLRGALLTFVSPSVVSRK